MARVGKREPPTSGRSNNGNGGGAAAADGDQDGGRVLRAVKRERFLRGSEDVGVGDGAHQLEDSMDRRVLRSKYLALHNKINDERDDLTRIDSDKFDSLIKEVEDLHQLVQKPREQVADAEALLGIASTLVSSVKSQSNEGITAAEFVSCLLSEFGQSGRRVDDDDNVPIPIKWRDIGLSTLPIFRMCHGFSTMLGPMNAGIKQRKVAVQRMRHVRPTETAQPEDVDETWGEEKTDTDKNMSIMFEILRKKKSARLEHLILNRRSFAQTVENLFALSFLVKDGRAEVTVDDSGSHFISPRNAPAASSVMSGDVAYRHFVFRFDFRDWKQMTNLVADGEELMPNRESPTDSQVEPLMHNSQETKPRTPIRKLSRNRGLVIQEEIVDDSPESDDVYAAATGLRRCKRKLI